MNEESDIRLKQIRELQLIQISLIKVFKEICETQNLRYCMLGGTMLGAVRHKGYIPWDDDADFGMPRPDYEIFLKLAKDYLPEDIQMLTFMDTPGYSYSFIRLADKKKKIKWAGRQTESIENLAIDIHPLDGLPNKPLRRKLHLARLMLLRMFCTFCTFDKTILLQKSGRTAIKQVAISICAKLRINKWFGDPKKWFYKLSDTLKKYSYDTADYVINCMGAYKLKEMFEKYVYDKRKEFEFEDMKLQGLQNFDIYLKQLYGDYMTPPPEEERNWHNTEVIDSSSQVGGGNTAQ